MKRIKTYTQSILTRLRSLIYFFIRNFINLKQYKYKTKRNRVNLHWWRLSSDQQNIGDYLSCVIVQHMLNHYSINGEAHTRTKHLYAIGSIISSGYQNAVVWGSGCLQDMVFWWRKLRKLDIRCVRGPLTREIMLNNGYTCPAIYGDPAILMPLVYTPPKKSAIKTKPYIVVPNHNYAISNPYVVSPITTDYQSFIDQITSAERVISSSLHGIILAEVYGVPAILLAHPDMDLLKYRDWYYSTGRTDFPIAHSIEEGLLLNPSSVSPDTLDSMRSKLIDVFPKDIWQNIH